MQESEAPNNHNFSETKGDDLIRIYIGLGLQCSRDYSYELFVRPLICELMIWLVILSSPSKLYEIFHLEMANYY